MHVLLVTNHSIDLVVVSDPNPDHMLECSTIPPLANSDHYGLLFGSAVLLWQSKLGPVGKYGDMPTWSWIEHACDMLQFMDLDLIFASYDVYD